MICTRCSGTGFLNIDQVPQEIIDKGVTFILEWMDELNAARIRTPCSCHLNPPCHSCVEYVHDVEVCDCCGNGETHYGEPGQHYGNDDPCGPKGPYASNGGLCKCH